MDTLLASLKMLGVTLVVCCVLYPAAILGLGQLAVPASANGSLIETADGRVVGSELIAQGFASPGYVWPRPSAVDYDAAGTGGSNLSPTNPELRERAVALIAQHGVDAPVPPELLTASGSGMDPHITERAALFQAPRVAEARGVDAGEVERVVRQSAGSASGLSSADRIVNVLALNLALDRAFGEARGTAVPPGAAPDTLPPAPGGAE